MVWFWQTPFQGQSTTETGPAPTRQGAIDQPAPIRQLPNLSETRVLHPNPIELLNN